MRKDDSYLDKPDLIEVERQAERLLKDAGAWGCLPTPVDNILSAAKLKVVGDVRSKSLVANFLADVRSGMIKRAGPIISEIKGLFGLLHVPTGEILLDSSQHKKKKLWIKLHETGHGFLPHQRRVYTLLEEGAYTLDPDIEDQFEREANNFAAEVLFQRELFQRMAADYVTSIRTAKDLSSKFGASIYASMRRYVTTHHRSLTVAVYERSNNLLNFQLRRAPFYSRSYVEKFGGFPWPESCGPSHRLWHYLSGPKLQEDTLMIRVNQNKAPWNIQVFNNSYQIFVLLFPVRKPIFSSIAA